MKFYYIKDSYIEFLREYDLKVSINKQGSRPYVGVVLEVDGIKYYAPFTSPKAKLQSSVKLAKRFGPAGRVVR